jgi:hypothetical protein
MAILIAGTRRGYLAEAILSQILFQNSKLRQVEAVVNPPPFLARSHQLGFFERFQMERKLRLRRSQNFAEFALEYLKTYRLSAAQTRRVYLLSQLAKNGWNLAATAQSMNVTPEELVQRCESVGFGYLFTEQVRSRARKR